MLHLSSRRCLTPLPPVSTSSPVLRPPVSHRGVHRSLLHGLQAVHDPAQPGLPPQSGRYPFFTVQLDLSGATYIRRNRPPTSVWFASSLMTPAHPPACFCPPPSSRLLLSLFLSPRSVGSRRKPVSRPGGISLPPPPSHPVSGWLSLGGVAGGEADMRSGINKFFK